MITIPLRLKNKLEKDQGLNGIVLQTAATYGQIFRANQLEFFPEYTDHGIRHIESVILAADYLIDDSTLNDILKPKDVAILVLAIFLHDLGMHLTFTSFTALINGQHDDILIEELEDKPWKILYEEYLEEAKKFSGKQRKAIFGNEFQEFKTPSLTNDLDLTKADRLLIGEFIRRHHPRIAQEVALKGLPEKDSRQFEFASGLDLPLKQICGIVARSHGMEIRDTFDYLKTFSEDEWAHPYDVHVTFLMVVLRIADYFQFDAERVDRPLLKLKTFSSPISSIEHDKHLAIEFVKPSSKDPETFHAEAKPNNSYLLLKLDELMKNIQYELDISWATLGEIYGKENFKSQPKIKFRRIKSNLDHRNKFVKELPFVPEKLTFDYDSELSKLLVAPLYGDNPVFGIRELIQNAVDACREREHEMKVKGVVYDPIVQAGFEKNQEGELYFFIKDNGKGMTLFELKNYFLKAGSSFRKSNDWQKKYTDEEGNAQIMRSGRFGIGALAAFLIGDQILVETYNIQDKFKYIFQAKLDDIQIEIKRIIPNSEESGTTIKIPISSEKAKVLDNIQKPVSWYSWYYLKKPKFIFKRLNKDSFYKLNEQVPDYNEQLPNHWHQLRSNYFEKVYWSYEPKQSMILVNGIRIPQSVQVEFNDIPGIRYPSISIFDFNGKCDLDLNRNRIRGNLPFENILLEDILKDVVAQLLCFRTKYILKNEALELQQPNTLSEHPFYNFNISKIVYHPYGFLPMNSYFTKKFQNSSLLSIGLEASRNIPTLTVLNSLNNTFFDFNITIKPKSRSAYNQLIDYNSYSVFDVNSACEVLMPKSLYEENFHVLPTRTSRSIRDNHKIIKQDLNWSLIDFYDCQNKILINYFDLIIKNKDLLYVKQTTMSQKNSTQFSYPKNDIEKRLWEIFSKYIGENYIIPYELDDRKKTYPKAFEELEVYMRKYLPPIP